MQQEPPMIFCNVTVSGVCERAGAARLPAFRCPLTGTRRYGTRGTVSMSLLVQSSGTVRYNYPKLYDNKCEYPVRVRLFLYGYGTSAGDPTGHYSYGPRPAAST
eukprot:scaffold657379_cov60-Prasinocladus_malaysianus.AAC.1